MRQRTSDDKINWKRSFDCVSDFMLTDGSNDDDDDGNCDGKAKAISMAGG